MLTKENFTKEHIDSLRQTTGADPSILERTVYAFGLLEAIAKTGMPFVFKGGTSLMLLLEEPRRLSTDIDIIVEPEVDVDEYIREAGKIFPFTGVEEDERKGKSDIVKRHFRFVFNSPRIDKEFNILLDVVFEHCPYTAVVSRPIRSSLLLSEGDDLSVIIPEKNCILGDKLTAFAPHTTGIKFGEGKELEIIKQMFDCYTLIQEIDNYSRVRDTYNEIAKIELGYRGLNIDVDKVLRDTINSCICIMGRGALRLDEYKYYQEGIGSIRGHVFKGKVNGENAPFMACEIMYLAACLLTGQEFERTTDSNEYINKKFDIKGIKRINYIRNVDLYAYSYLVKALDLLQSIGLYRNNLNDDDLDIDIVAEQVLDKNINAFKELAK